MYEYKNNNKRAVVVLHEIYGVNNFIEDMCRKLKEDNFDVFCPSLLQRQCFSYSQCDEAYEYFMNKVGFEAYKDVQSLVLKLKNEYEKVFVIGFSVGATIAWRCCEDGACDKVICCYGSRIRDYLEVNPKSDTLLLFAEHDSFDVDKVVSQLEGRDNLKIIKFNASHGFMDKYNSTYDLENASLAEKYIKEFIRL